MSIFPFIDIENIPTPNNDPLPMYKEVAWDYVNNIPVLENGDFKIVEGVEALKVWAYKAILSNRYEHEVYSWDYGCEINSFIGQNYSKGLVESESKRYIEEALMINPYITGVNVTSVSFSDNLLRVEAKVNTIYGDMEVRM